jgi:FAD synthase
MVLTGKIKYKITEHRGKNKSIRKMRDSKPCYSSIRRKFFKIDRGEFVSSVLVDQFHIHKIIIGMIIVWGTANIDDLISFGEQYGFAVEQISVQEINDMSVSSTKIRNAYRKET